jgi:methyl-accepting chemotaxis protein
MKPTIRNKLIGGFSGLIVVILGVASIGAFSVFSLRRSAFQTTRVGDRLNSESLQVQVHALQAESQVRDYLNGIKTMGAQQAKDTYLDEAEFEVNEIQNLTANLVKIAPSEEKRAKFERISVAAGDYTQALDRIVKNAGMNESSPESKAALTAYEEAATHLRESGEDGEVAGHDASQTSQEEIQATSKRSVALVTGASLLGLILAMTMAYTLSRAILVPVQHLKDVAENVSMGNLDMNVRRYSDDEIGDLADSFSRMVTAVKFFRSEAENIPIEAGVERGGN